jgi:hypothetical protein
LGWLFVLSSYIGGSKISLGIRRPGDEDLELQRGDSL